MTLKETALRLGKSENTIYKNFKRTQETLAKRGIILTRIAKDNYTIEYKEEKKG
jgi:transcriptional antiterminator